MAGRAMPISPSMNKDVMNAMPTLNRRAEGLATGFSVLPILPWRLDPAQETPGRLCPMWVTPPPQRSVPQRLMSALGQLGTTLAAGAGLMMLASYLAIPG
jgi:hypothetical protein